jgi:xanthine dehydrogenase large subunit
MSSPLGKALPHESAARHVSGGARYVDDLPEPKDLLHALPVVSPHAHARLVSLDPKPARSVPGVVAVLTAADIPGKNDCSPVGWGEPLFAEDEVHCVGQYVAVVVGESVAACRAGVAAVKVAYEPLPAILSIRAAIEADAYIGEPAVIARGNVEAALADAPMRFSGEVDSGGQDHFYLETQAALCIPGEDDTFHVFSSTQHPSEVQHKVAEVLGVGSHKIVVTCPRMGGGFGGKETQGNQPAAMATLAARRTGRPVKIRYDRDSDMAWTGKRHPFHNRFTVGADRDGRLLALKVEAYADGGWSPDLSKAVLARALFHLDNAYFIPAVHCVGRIARTNTVSHTAFRGFGGPQGVIVIEEILSRLAERLGADPAEIRRKNYYGDAPRHLTHYGQPVKDNRLARIHEGLMTSSDYTRRRAQIEAFNARSPWVKRGIGFSPVKFGISFTKKTYNQAGAYVLVYADGTVQLNHGGTEMGQGLHTKMLAVAANALGAPLDRIRMMDTATDKVPNTSATAASSGSDLNGQAVRQACEAIRERLRPIAARLLGIADDEGDGLVFESGRIWLPGNPEAETTFDAAVQAAYEARVPLSATGFYRTPGIHFDAEKGRGNPFYYYAYGAAVTEIEVSGLTGEYRIHRADILHDVGDSLVPTIDRGQVEGGYVQGVGWLTMEELVWDDAGRLMTRGASTYNVPAIGDAPVDFRVALLDRAPQDGVIHGSKAVGEPPFMLGISAVVALRHAVGAFREAGAEASEVPLRLPATPEAVLRAVEAVRTRATAGAEPLASGASVGTRSA